MLEYFGYFRRQRVFFENVAIFWNGTSREKQFFDELYSEKKNNMSEVLVIMKFVGSNFWYIVINT